MAVTLLQLRTRVRQRTDNEHTGDFVTNDELNQLINTKVLELYELLVIHGLHRTESTYTITPLSTSPAETSYDLPADLFAVLGVYGQASTSDPGRWLTRHDHRVVVNGYFPGDADTYRVVGSTLELNPPPTSGVYTVRYVPVPAELTDDADTFDGVLGWDEYIVVAVSIDVLDKEDGDQNTIMRLENRLARLKDRIKLAAQNAEMSEAVTIAKVRVSAFDRVRMPGDFTTTGIRGVPF